MDKLLGNVLGNISLYLNKKPFWDVGNSKIFIYGTGTVAQQVYHVLLKKVYL